MIGWAAWKRSLCAMRQVSPTAADSTQASSLSPTAWPRMADSAPRTGHLAQRKRLLRRRIRGPLDGGQIRRRPCNQPVSPVLVQATAAHLVTGAEFYTDLLHRYGVGWRVLYSNDPGKVLYEDDVQIVVAPRWGCDPLGCWQRDRLATFTGHVEGNPLRHGPLGDPSAGV